MPSKEVVTFWLVTSAPMSLLSLPSRARLRTRTVARASSAGARADRLNVRVPATVARSVRTSRRSVAVGRAVALAAPGLVVAVVLSLAACAAPGPSTPIASSSPSSTAEVPTSAPTATPPPGPTATVADAAPTFPPSQQPIEPGTYGWDGFEPAITITLAAGWALGHDNPAFFDLFRGSDFPSVTFARMTDVYTDRTAHVPALDAATVVAALGARGDIRLSGLEPVDLGGLPGQSFDLATLEPQTPLFISPAGDFRLDPAFATRYRVLDVPGGGVLVIGIHAPSAAFDTALTLGEPVVASLSVRR